jgi:hypothetical protein
MTPVKTYVAVLLGCLTAAAAQADCSLPAAPSKIPDGSSASDAEMLTAMQTLKTYDSDVTAYLKCLEFESRQNRLSQDEQVKRHNSAVDRLQTIAAKFNEQVRVFKAKQG